MLKRIWILAIVLAIMLAMVQGLGLNLAFAATKPALGTALNTSHSLANGLVGCWLLNENSGSIVYDSTSNNNNGDLEGNVSWTTGNFSGPALDFDGSADYVDFGTSFDKLDGVSEFTISFYSNWRVKASYDGIIGKYINGNNQFYCQSQSTATEIAFAISDGSLAYGETDNFLSTVPWYHVVIRYDGSGADNPARLKIYVDGTEKSLSFAGTTIPAATPTLSATDFYFGFTCAVLQNR